MENTIEKKLDAMLGLQAIDCELDEIVQTRGALPNEVLDLKDELASLQARSQDIQQAIVNTKRELASHRVGIKDLEATVEKYEAQQMDVRNNREYDAITKEIDLQKLEIQLTEKKVKNVHERIESHKIALEQCQASIDKQQQILGDKEGALQALVGESEGEEQKLQEQRHKMTQRIDAQLLTLYERIRRNVRNKLAVVVVKRDACGGCFNQVPPQKQADIKEKKRVNVCEHCGRIIADVLVPLPLEDA